MEDYRRRAGEPPPEPQEIDGDLEWEVDKIIGKRKRQGSIQYLVRWEGYGDAEDTWLWAENLENSHEAIAEFEKQAEEAQLARRAAAAAARTERKATGTKQKKGKGKR